MDDIQDIVQSIVRGCSHGGQEVSEILAAFVAKTVRQSIDMQSMGISLQCCWYCA